MAGRGVWTPVGGCSNVVIGGVTYGFYELWTPNVGSTVVLDTSRDPNALDYRAVNYGVKAIQRQLNRLFGAGLDVDGWHGKLTDAAVRAAQQAWGMTTGYTPGRVGTDFAKRLFRPLVLTAEANYGIPGHLVGGLVDLESSFDPGAVGQVTDKDKGLAQFHVDGSSTWWNAVNTEITVAKAFDAEWAIENAAARMAYYRKRFSGKGADLQTKCGIAQHNAPTWAQQWYDTGSPPNTTIAKYVSLVLTRAQAF